jgi:hypothetical protein
MDCAIHLAFIKYSFSRLVLLEQVMIKRTSTYIDLKTYLFAAFSLLKITWAVSEVVLFSPAMGRKEREESQVLIINEVYLYPMDAVALEAPFLRLIVSATGHIRASN